MRYARLLLILLATAPGLRVARAQCISDAIAYSNWTWAIAKNVKSVTKDGVSGFEIDKTSGRHRFAVTAARKYVCDLKLFGVDPDKPPITIQLIWLAADGSEVSRTLLGRATYPISWDRYTFGAVAPAGAVQAELYVGNDQEKIYLGEVCVREAGVAGTASRIAGLVFNDSNNDGLRGQSEERLAGTTLVLYRDNGNGIVDPALDQVVTTTTSAIGDSGYEFADLTAGNYYVLGFLLPTKILSPGFNPYSDTRNSDFDSYTHRGFSVAVTKMSSLDGSNEVTYVDMGQYQTKTAALYGYMWADVNANLTIDEPLSYGVNGLTVKAFRNGVLYATSATRNDALGRPGYYLFNFIDPALVTVEVVLPQGVKLRDLGNENMFSPLTNQSASVPLVVGQVVANTSAAMWMSGTEICDNGVDDDHDGKIDDADSDCTDCVVADEVLCGETLKYYVPPMWQMIDDVGGTTYNGPSYLLISTAASTASIKAYTPDGSWVRTRTVTSSGSVSIALTKELGQTPNPNTPERSRGIILESDQPIQVVHFLDGSYNKELVTIKGAQALGNEFYAGSQVAQYETTCSPTGLPLPNVAKAEAHFVSVLATENNSRVTFTFDNTKLILHGGLTSPHTVTLQAGQSYVVRDAYTNQTVSGVRVTSDKAVAVNSGSQHTNVCNNGGLDAGIDQLVPTCYLGSDYVLVKHKGTDNQHYGVVVATQDGTAIRIDGGATAVATINRGQWYRVKLTGVNGDPHIISTSQPSYVYHISGISTNNEVGMAIAAPWSECRGDRYLTFQKATGDNNINVVTLTAGLPNLTLNGMRIDTAASVFTRPVPGQPTLSSLIVPDGLIAANNVLRGSVNFQVSHLIGISGSSGTFGYLTSFSDEIKSYHPTTQVPTPRYTLRAICAGEQFTHTISAESCNSSVAIQSIANNTSLGRVVKTGDLSFRYESMSSGYGKDVVSLRVRDSRGLEKSICIDVFVCGAAVPVLGLAPDATLACGEAVPISTPVIFSLECPITGEIPSKDTTILGSCPGSYKVIRTWSKTSGCGVTITAKRVYTFVDDLPPTFANVPAASTLCAGDPIPASAPTVSDGCSSTDKIAVVLTSTTEAIAGTASTMLTRTWTATDECGNRATVSQVISIKGLPTATGTVTDATCGERNGGLSLTWPADAERTSVNFSINGTWSAVAAVADRAYTFRDLSPGTYVIGARWAGGDCQTVIGTFTVVDESVAVAPIQFWDLDGGTGRNIKDEATYHIVRDLPSNWNVRTELSGASPGSLRYVVTGGASMSLVDNATPFTLPGDNTRLGWRSGRYTIVAEGFTRADASGSNCATRTVTFTLVDFEICDNGIDDDGDGNTDDCDQSCPGNLPVAGVSH